MTNWKAGYRAMVEIAYDSAGTLVSLKNGCSGTDTVFRTTLQPLPPAKTAAEAALIERIIGLNWQESTPVKSLVDAVLAERAPKDPVEVGLAAYRKALTRPGYDMTDCTELAICAALDAAKEQSK